MAKREGAQQHMDVITKSRFRIVIGGSWTSLSIAGVVVIVLAISGLMLIATHAATFFASVNPTQGTVATNAKVVTDSSALGGKAIQFNAPTVVMPPPPPPPTGGGGTSAFCQSFPALPSTKPTASNTGVPAGTALTASGSITVTTAGTIINAKDVAGQINVNANNVTIENSKVHPSGGGNTDGIIVGNGVTGTKILNDEVYTTNGGYIGISASNSTVCGSYIHGYVNAMTIGGNMTIQANYMDKMVWYPGSDAPHYDGIEIYYSGNSKIWGNNINLTNASGGWLTDTNCVNIAPYQSGSVVDNVQINGNWFGGGSYSLGVREQNGGIDSNIQVTNNRWYRSSYAYGPSDVEPASTVTVWTNNVFDDNGQAIGK